MYEEAEYTAIREQLRKRLILTLIPAGILLAGIVVAAINRRELPTEILSMLLCVGLIFAWGVLLRPLRQYSLFLNGVLHGPNHEAEGRWNRIEEEVSMVDGVATHAVYLDSTDSKGKPCEHQFYLDAEKRASFAEPPRGQMVRVIYHDRFLIGMGA